MKKSTCFFVAVLLLFSLASPVLGATNATTVKNDNGSFTTSGTIDQNENKFVTIVVYDGGSISVDSIQYIDQVQADANGNFEFKNYYPKTDVNVGDAPYQVKVGATALTVPISAGFVGPDPGDGFTVTGQFSADGNGNLAKAQISLTTDQGVSIKGTIGVDGTFTIASVPAGTYNMIISKPGFLSVVVPVTVSNNDISISDNISLLAGDVNGDHRILINDVNQMISVFGVVSQSGNFDPNCDFNDDGKILMNDFNNLLSNFGKVGDLFDNPSGQ